MNRPLFIVVLCGLGCETVDQQPRYRAWDSTNFFSDGLATRQPPAGTVESIPEAEPLPKITAALLARGGERYTIYCEPCHGQTGAGDGMIVKRGFVPPPTFHTDARRRAPLSYVVAVIANGLGAMKSYRAQVAPADQWAIAAYVRALQISQHVSVADLSDAERTAFASERSQ